MSTAWGNTPLTNRGASILVSGTGSLNAAGTIQTLGVAVDLDNKRFWVRIGRGIWSGTSGNPATNTGGFDITTVVSGSVFPAWSPFNATNATTLNCGPVFEMDIPVGFSAWDATGATTWDAANKDASITLTNSNTTATGTAAGSWRSVRGTTGHTTGKYYMEFGADFVDASNGWMAGIVNASGPLNNYIGSTNNGTGAQSGPFNISIWKNASNTGTSIGAVTTYSNAPRSIRSTVSHITGKFYIELLCAVLDGNSGWYAGITNVSGPLNNFIGSDNNSAAWTATGGYYKNGAFTTGAFSPVLTATHIMCVAVDLLNNTMWVRVDNGSWSGVSGNPVTNTGGVDITSVNDGIGVYIGFTTFDIPSIFDKVTANFGASAFSFTPPTGFVTWDTVANTTLPSRRTGMPRALRVR